ncbi:hypothetical protein V8E53_001316 [Lactarius tabidus]
MTCSKATCTLTQWTGGDQPLMLDDEEMAPPPVTSPVGKDTTTDAEVGKRDIIKAIIEAPESEQLSQDMLAGIINKHKSKFNTKAASTHNGQPTSGLSTMYMTTEIIVWRLQEQRGRKSRPSDLEWQIQLKKYSRASEWEWDGI